jgi:hypothetical protein
MWVIPDFRIWVIFLQGEKIFWEQKFAHLLAMNFAIVLLTNFLLWYGPLQLSKGLSLLTNLAAVYYGVMPGLVLAKLFYELFKLQRGKRCLIITVIVNF